MALYVRAMTRFRAGSNEEALQLARRAVQLSANGGQRRHRHVPVLGLAEILSAEGRLQEALTTLTSIEGDLRSRDARTGLLALLSAKADTLAEMGRLEESNEALRDLVQLRQETDRRNARQQMTAVQAQREIDRRNREVQDARRRQELAEVKADHARLLTIASVLAALGHRSRWCFL